MEVHVRCSCKGIGSKMPNLVDGNALSSLDDLWDSRPDGPDSLNHYAFCPYIKSVTDQCNSASNELSLGCKLGLDIPCNIDMKWVAAMFYAYHAVSLHPVARSLQSVESCQQIPTTDFQLFQQIFAGSFEAALKHAC